MSCGAALLRSTGISRAAAAASSLGINSGCGAAAAAAAAGSDAVGSGAGRALRRLPGGSRVPVRRLNLHEHQSQEIMRSFDVAVPRGRAVQSAAEAERYARELIAAPGQDAVVKAQVLAGGRGLGTFQPSGFRGGVHIAHSPEAAGAFAGRMLGQRLVTKQTGAEGKPCNKVFVTERLYARREIYLAILYDRESQGPVAVASKRGGTSIEDIAKETPDAITKVPLEVVPQGETMGRGTAEQVATALGFGSGSVQHEKATELVRSLYRMFLAKDCTLVEVNPLTETPDGDVVCVDAKVNFDDNAAFRQADAFALRDTSQEDPREVAAAKHDLNYIGLDGNIGCLVNGAGLAMATMDIIKLNGGNPANFLDVGGSATEEQVTEAFKILSDDPKVEAIMVNIFGGIMRCDVIAQGIVSAAKTIQLGVPLVVRLEGNKVDEAKKIMASSDVRIMPANDLDEAAARAVKVADIVRAAREADVRVQFDT